LYYACHPEKAYKSGDEKEHFPRTDLGTGKMTFGKYNADYKKDSKPHQLEELEPRNIVYQFNLSQS
jgi:hypothetical protein